MTATITITFGGTTYSAFCRRLIVSGKTNTDAKPDVNGADAVSVQTLSYENPKYVFDGVELTGTARAGETALTYAKVLDIYRNRYDGTNGVTVSCIYGTSTNLVGVDGTTTNIPVVLSDYSLPLDAKDSKDAELPSMKLTFMETK